MLYRALMVSLSFLLAAPVVGQEVNLNQALHGLGVWTDQWSAMAPNAQSELLQAERRRLGVDEIPGDVAFIWGQLTTEQQVSLLLLRRVDEVLWDREVPSAPAPAPQVVEVDPSTLAAVAARRTAQGRLQETPYVAHATRPPGGLNTLQVGFKKGAGEGVRYYALLVKAEADGNVTVPVETATFLRVDVSSICQKWPDRADRSACLEVLGPQPYRWVPVVAVEDAVYVTPSGSDGGVYAVALSGSPDGARGLDAECVEELDFRLLRDGRKFGERPCRYTANNGYTPFTAKYLARMPRVNPVTGEP